MEVAKVINVKKVRKEKYVIRLREYLEKFNSAIVVQVDNVGSNQMQQTRIALRGKAVLLMGKNTLMRKYIKEAIAKKPQLEALSQFVYGNMGLVFTNHDLNEVRKIILNNKVPAAARAGSFAPSDVFIPPGPTGMDPGQTSFFQAVNIGTKIVKGTIEIINTVHLLKPGDKVTASHVALLTKLNILPFFYGFKVTDVYDNGSAYSADILDLSKEDLLNKFSNGVRKLAALSLGANHPTTASLPFIVSGAFSKILGVSLATDYTFPEAQKIKDMLANPGAFVATATAVPAAGGKAGAAPAAAAEKPKEKSEESEQDMGFSLFE